MNVVIATGGSGGHVIPALKVAEQLQQRNCRVRFVGSLKAWRERVSRAGFPVEELELCGIVASRPLESLRALWLLGKGTWAGTRLLREHRIEVVAGFGGYGSFPAVLAAILARIPTLIHEQNVLPGRANAVLSRMVQKIAISFPQSRPYFPLKKIVVTGCPSHVPGTVVDQKGLLQEFGLEQGRKTILVLGGSQGSRRINEVFLQAAAALKDKIPLQVIHLCGKNDYLHLKEQYSRPAMPVALFEFFERMDRIYAVADLVVGRAGAVSVTELIRFRKPAILIPYPHAGGHQRNNAQVLAQAGVGRWVAEKDFSASWLENAAGEMLAHPPLAPLWERHFQELLATDSAAALAETIIGMKR